jgi:TM2 domain-containing membrane protein YozV
MSQYDTLQFWERLSDSEGSFAKTNKCDQSFCRNGYRYDTALLLSVFLGFLGADRLYLGHVGMGALKFCTLGFFFIGHLLDIILIATQYVNPIDGSEYIVGFYGPAVQSVRSDNLTHIVRRPDWYSE